MLCMDCLEPIEEDEPTTTYYFIMDGKVEAFPVHAVCDIHKNVHRI